ncbi:hypothetical protein [Rhizobium sp. RM]|uniref:hypothetical protein n=1 Tax=Rhizobium sp. RM TaxID=2748079 RepID=UPI001FEDBAE2|nr:hypothetical protein [Rhizobium sp. RM]
MPVSSVAQRRSWLAIRSALGGRSGLIAVPVWSQDVAPYASGGYEEGSLVPHSDLSTFSDGTEYSQGAMSIKTVGVSAIGQTTIRLRVISGSSDLSGVRFSYEHALYETGRIIQEEDGVITVSISPTVRSLIPSDADLEFDEPTCLCHLSSDDQMGAGVDPVPFERRSVSFVEATDYWNKLALGLV